MAARGVGYHPRSKFSRVGCRRKRILNPIEFAAALATVLSFYISAPCELGRPKPAPQILVIALARKGDPADRSSMTAVSLLDTHHPRVQNFILGKPWIRLTHPAANHFPYGCDGASGRPLRSPS